MNLPLNKKIIVIGSNGYLGRHVCKYLQSMGANFFAADLQPVSIDGLLNYKTINLLNKSMMSDMFSEFDYIMLFSGKTGTFNGFSEANSFIEINEVGLVNLLNSVKDLGKDIKILFPSTRLVYKGKENIPLTEDSEKEFKTVYAINKYSCEKYLEMYNSLFGINYSIIRICVPYGTLMHGEQSYGTLTHFLKQAKNKSDITIYGDGSQKRSFIHIADLSRACVEIMISNLTNNGIYNVGGPDTLSIKDVATEIGNLYGVGITSVPWPEEQLKIESGDTIFDSSKFINILNFVYNYNFKAWLRTIGEKL